MATILSIADDVMNALSMSHDDRLLNRVAIAYNVKIAVDRLRAQAISKDYHGDIREASDMMELFVVDVTNHTADATIEWDCMYFDLPRELYDLPFDGGLAWVRYHRTGLPANCPPQLARTVFTHTTLGSLSALWDMTYQAPCDTRPYVARDKDRVYVFGVQQQVTKLHVGLFCALPNLDQLTDENINDDIGLPPEKLMAVRKLVIDSARFSLQLPERLKNDGRDLEPNQPIRTERQVSLNDPLNIEP
jgi:hypothetical protein